MAFPFMNLFAGAAGKKNPAMAANPYGALISGALQQGQAQGAFDPSGSPAIMARLRRQGLRNRRNRGQRTSILNQLMGANPMQARQALLDTERADSGDLSDFLNQAQLGEMTGGRDWLRGLLTGERQSELSRQERQMDLEEERKGRRRKLYGDIFGLSGQFLGD